MKIIFKKIIALCFVLALTVSLAACENGGNTENGNNRENDTNNTIETIKNWGIIGTWEANWVYSQSDVSFYITVTEIDDSYISVNGKIYTTEGYFSLNWFDVSFNDSYIYTYKASGELSFQLDTVDNLYTAYGMEYTLYFYPGKANILESVKKVSSPLEPATQTIGLEKRSN